MQTVTTVGLEIAKSIFQVYGVGAEGNAREVLRVAIADRKSAAIRQLAFGQPEGNSFVESNYLST